MSSAEFAKDPSRNHGASGLPLCICLQAFGIRDCIPALGAPRRSPNNQNAVAAAAAAAVAAAAAAAAAETDFKHIFMHILVAVTFMNMLNAFDIDQILYVNLIDRFTLV